MDQLLLKIIELLVIITITIVVRYGIPLVERFIEDAKLKSLMQWVDKAVLAAQQTIRAEGSGADKKAIVTKFLKEILTAKNISISDEQLDILIEAAVYAMNNA